MGYGLSPPGSWKGARTLTWFMLNDKPSPQFWERALDIWGQGLGITFQKTLTKDGADFRVTVVTQGTAWTPSMKLMSLQNDDTLGVCLHEVGHLLGLQHEQDRPDQRATFYATYAVNLREELLRTKKIQKPEQAETADTFVKRAETNQANKKLLEYGAYDASSIMLYPDTNYLRAQTPSAGDFDTARKINGW